MGKIVFTALIVMVISGCANTFSKRTPAERESGYTYIPIDPFSVEVTPGCDCEKPDIGINSDSKEHVATNTCSSKLLNSFPDNAVRMSVERLDASGAVTYGSSGIGIKGESYRVTVDYINADTTNFRVWIRKNVQTEEGKEYFPLENVIPRSAGFYIPGTEIYNVLRDDDRLTTTRFTKDELKDFTEYNIPVYVGIGLRVNASVDVIEGQANISGLGAIGSEAEANKLKGSLVVQTLGVNGKSIAAALPIQSELNRSTAQNAIVAIGSIKALLYEDETRISPRVVGLYLPFPVQRQLVNHIISELSKKKIIWNRPCVFRTSTNLSKGSS